MSKNTIIGLIVLVLVIAGIIWLVNRDGESDATPVLSVSAFNQTKNSSATDNTAAPDDIIVYTLTAQNQTDEVIAGYIIEANISEIANVATLIDASGASYNSGTNSLVWTPRDIQPHESISQQFTVRVNPLPEGTSNATMNISFNNELVISIASTSQVAGNQQGSSYVAPTTGASEYLPGILALLATAIFIAVRKYRFVKA